MLGKISVYGIKGGRAYMDGQGRRVSVSDHRNKIKVSVDGAIHLQKSNMCAHKYAFTVWSPGQKLLSSVIEKVQRRAARYVWQLQKDGQRNSHGR